MGIALPRSAAAQSEVTLTLDLSKPKEQTEQLPAAGHYDLRVDNRLPNSRYTYVIQVVVRTKPIPPLTMPSGQVSESALKSICEDLRRVTTKLQEATKESDIPAILDEARKLKPQECGNTADVESFTSMVAATSMRKEVPEVRQGQDVVVTVTKTWRDDSGKDQKEEWIKTFEGEARGEWKTSYGFLFIADLFSRNRSYHSEADTGGTFRIAQDESRSRARFVPSVIFSWLPRRAEASDLVYSISAGLGFDLTRPVVALAPIGLVYNQNVSLQLGVAFHPVDKLKGKYDEGDTIKENLTPDDLREDALKSYGVNPFIALSFNFSSNPFSSGSKAKEDQKTESKGK